jgi:hypothetical protein
VEEQKDRFESTEPEDDDVEGHRLANRTVGESEETDREDERLAEPDVEAHRVVDRTYDRAKDDKAID